MRPWSFLSMWPHVVILFAFLPGITENWLIFSSHFMTGLKVVLKLKPFEQGMNYLTSWRFLPQEFYIPNSMEIIPITHIWFDANLCCSYVWLITFLFTGRIQHLHKIIHILSTNNLILCSSGKIRFCCDDEDGNFIVIHYELFDLAC